MLRESVAKFCVSVQALFEHVEIDWLILHRPTQRLAHLCRNLMVIHLDRSVQRIYLARVRCRVAKNCGNDATLVSCCNRRVAPIAKGKAQYAVLFDARDLTRVSEPLSEERRAQMRDRRAGPVEHLLRDPMV